MKKGTKKEVKEEPNIETPVVEFHVHKPGYGKTVRVVVITLCATIVAVLTLAGIFGTKVTNECYPTEAPCQATLDAAKLQQAIDTCGPQIIPCEIN